MDQIEFLATLQTVIQERLRNPTDSSYTARLAEGGEKKVAQKLGEEAVEVVVAAMAEDASRLTEEAADLLYHLLVLLSVKGLSIADVVGELERRHLARVSA